MSRFISKEGEWYPANERVILTNHSTKSIKNPSTKGKYVDEMVAPGEQFIYEGPCRAALFELYEAKIDKLGQSFRKNPDFLQSIRTQGFNSIDEYLTFIGYNKEEAEASFKANASVVTKHEIGKRVKAMDTMGGGKDFSGQGEDIIGGFGDPKIKSAKNKE